MWLITVQLSWTAWYWEDRGFGAGSFGVRLQLLILDWIDDRLRTGRSLLGGSE